MKTFQISRDAATNAPASPTKNPSPAIRLHAATPRATHQIHHPTQISTRQPVEIRITFLINGQNIRIHRNQLKTNHSPRF
jgi:hypothetical protein